MACFDYAASAPYVEIDMNPAPGKYEGDASIDAVFISPHKFLGGPGSSGVLVFNKRIYHEELPPSVSAGGTVDYVGPTGQDFIADIEEREKAGTPGVLQILKAGLAFAVKDRIGVPAIEAREHERTGQPLVDRVSILALLGQHGLPCLQLSQADLPPYMLRGVGLCPCPILRGSLSSSLWLRSR